MKKTISIVSQLGEEIGDLNDIEQSYRPPGIAQQPNPMQHDSIFCGHCGVRLEAFVLTVVNRTELDPRFAEFAIKTKTEFLAFSSPGS